MANGNQTPAPQAPPQAGTGQIEVWSPPDEKTGIVRRGTIPQSEVPLAMSQGYKAASAYVEAVHPKTGQTGIIPREEWNDASKQGFTLSPAEQNRVRFQQGMRAFGGLEAPDFPGAQQGLSAFTQAGQQQAATQQRYSGYERESGMFAGQAAAGMATGGLLPAAQGAGLLTRAGLAAGRAGLTAGAVGAGTLAGGGTPKEALEAGATAGVLQPVGEAATAVAGKVLKAGAKGILALRGESPERIAELQTLFPKEQALNRAVDTAETNSRNAFKAAYDRMGIDRAPVDTSAAKVLAKQAVEGLPELGQAVPRPLPAVAQAQSLLAPEANAGAMIRSLAEADQMPFRQVQELRANINKYISDTRPPAATYRALKSVANSLSDGLKQTAEREGQGQAFATAESMFKQHAADFWNKGAPLKPYLNVPEGREGSFNRFLQTVDRSRAIEALQRHGVPTGDLQNLMQKYGGKLGSQAWQGTLKDARLVRDMGTAALNQQVGAANRRAALGYAIKGAAGATGLGALGELYRLLSKARQSK